MVEAGIQRKLPPWFWAVAVLGIAWNIFGLVQFMGAVTATSASLAAKGMTPEQIDVYLSIPFWMNFAFGVGVIGGLIGSILMAVKIRALSPCCWPHWLLMSSSILATLSMACLRLWARPK